MTTNTSPMMALYQARDAVAVLPTLLVIAVLIGMQYDRAVVVHYKDEKKPVEVKLIDVAPPQEQPKLPPPPEPSKPTPQKAQPTPQPPQPQQKAPVQPETPQVVTTNAPSATSVPAPAVAPVPAPKQVEVAPPAPPPKPVGANLEGDYVAKVRGYLNAIKRYPKGREVEQQHPRGVVKVWFVLRRDGTLADSGVESSSNSMYLDDAALRTVTRATYPPFPESSWAGEATRRFTAELDFQPPS